MMVFVSCHTSYKYEQGVKDYLHKVHQINEENLLDKIFYIIDVESCECGKYNLEALAALANPTPKLTIILVGTADYVKELQSKFQSPDVNFLSDPQKQIFRYETGLGKPILLHFKNKQIIYHHYIIDPEIVNAIQYLEKIE